MSHDAINKTQWVELFQAAGLSDEMMHTWHQEFERRYPQGHQSFLNWLGLAAEEIDQIRTRFT